MDIRDLLYTALADVNDPHVWARVEDWMRRQGYTRDRAMHWEYKVLQFNKAFSPEQHEERLNAQGQDGWELVGIDAIGGQTVSVRYVLKRLRHQASSDEEET